MKRFSEWLELPENSLIYFVGLLAVNGLSAAIIQLAVSMSSAQSDYWLVQLSDLIGYGCYFMMLSVFIGCLVSSRLLKGRELFITMAYSLLFAFFFYMLSTLLSTILFSMMRTSDRIGSMVVGLAAMLFILFYLPVSVLVSMQFTSERNPFKMLFTALKLIKEHLNEVLAVLCVLAVFEGIDGLFGSAAAFNPLFYLRQILTRCNPFVTSGGMLSINVYTLVVGLLFTGVWLSVLFYFRRLMIHAVKK